MKIYIYWFIILLLFLLFFSLILSCQDSRNNISKPNVILINADDLGWSDLSLMGSNYFPDDNIYINLLKFSAFSDPSLVQFMHRNLAYSIIIFYFVLLIKIYSNKLANLYFVINLLGIVLFIQIVLGIFTLLYGAQIFLASMHQISSIFLVSASVYFLYLNSNQQPSN